MARGWCRTLRFEVSDADRERLTKSDEPVAVALWHNRLFLSPEFFRRYRTRRRVHGLVSARNDGAWLAALYRLVGIVPVRSSSNSFGRVAGRTLIDVMRQRHDIGITSDGPHRPCGHFESGVVVVTRRVEAPVVLIGARFTRAWKLNSWDRFYVPGPFSRIIVRSTVLPAKNPEGNRPDAESVRAALQAINPDLPD